MNVSTNIILWYWGHLKCRHCYFSCIQLRQVAHIQTSCSSPKYGKSLFLSSQKASISADGRFDRNWVILFQLNVFCIIKQLMFFSPLSNFIHPPNPSLNSCFVGYSDHLKNLINWNWEATLVKNLNNKAVSILEKLYCLKHVVIWSQTAQAKISLTKR